MVERSGTPIKISLPFGSDGSFDTPLAGASGRLEGEARTESPYACGCVGAKDLEALASIFPYRHVLLCGCERQGVKKFGSGIRSIN
ncbi:MAG: hypothetical protein ACOYN4_18550, partial [Bacteroidales bacterium]